MMIVGRTPCRPTHLHTNSTQEVQHKQHTHMSRCVQLKSFSDDMTSQLEIVERPIPAPKPEQVLVRVTCRPINPSEVYSLMGQYPGFQPKLPATPALEGCGVVNDNNGHTDVRKGQRVRSEANTSE